MSDFFDQNSNDDPSPEDRFQFLCARYFENELDDNQWTEFNESLRSSERMREKFFELSSCTHLIGELLRSEQFAERLSASAHKTTAKKLSLVVGGGLLLILVGLVLQHMFLEPPAPKALIAYVWNDVSIVDKNGRSTQAQVGMRVNADSTIETRGPQSLAMIQFDDDTRVVVAPQSLVRCANFVGKELTLDYGAMTATLSHPVKSAMIVNTPHAQVNVSGKAFSLEASSDRTGLSVTDGSANFTEKNSGKTILVQQGSTVMTNPTSGRLVAKSTTTNETWDEDFEKGLPKDWQIGKFVREGVGESNGAVRSVLEGNRLTIATTQRWVDGLFVVNDDTHLHMTLKMRRPNWINMFFLIRTNDPDDPNDLAICDTGPFITMKPDTWYNVTIPISELKVKPEDEDSFKNGKPPKSGDRVYDMNWTSLDPARGLVIDRVWVTRGGPGKVTRTLSNDE